MKVLAIDTASGQCSAALLLEGQVSSRAVPTSREHARLLLPMVDELLKEADIRLTDLTAIAFGRGPGSFTGLRIAASCAQGLALGSNRGVVPVSDLRALAEQALRRCRRDPAIRTALACMDARMSEVYWAAFPVLDGRLHTASVIERVGPPETVVCDTGPGVAAAGKGLAAWPAIGLSLDLPAMRRFDDAEPHAEDIARLAAADLESGFLPLAAAGAQPVYLRDQVAEPANSMVSGPL